MVGGGSSGASVELAPASDLLAQLGTHLTSVLGPSLESKGDWGLATADTVQGLRADLERFAGAVAGAHRGIFQGTVSLARASVSADFDVASAASDPASAAGASAADVDALETALA